MNLVALERYQTRTLLGVRFWDRLTNRTVAEGLQVVAQRLTNDLSRRLGKPVQGKVCPNGTIAFFGLTDAEIPADDTPELWEENSTPPPEFVVIDVMDSRNQFLPLSFVAQLPFRGIFQGVGAWLGTPLFRPESLDDVALGVQLWSAPARSPYPGWASIRGQLVVGTGDTPAAYAVVGVSLVDPDPDIPFDYFGMADSQGNLNLPIPYPPIPPPTTDDFIYPALEQQQFPLRITVQYSARTPSDFLPTSGVPNLAILLSQSSAAIGGQWTTDEPPVLQSQADLSLNLQFEQPLILRTVFAPGSATEPESVLRILPI